MSWWVTIPANSRLQPVVPVPAERPLGAPVALRAQPRPHHVGGGARAARAPPGSAGHRSHSGSASVPSGHGSCSGSSGHGSRYGCGFSRRVSASLSGVSSGHSSGFSPGHGSRSRCCCPGHGGGGGSASAVSSIISSGTQRCCGGRCGSGRGRSGVRVPGLCVSVESWNDLCWKGS